MTIGDRWRDVHGRPSGYDYMRVSLALAVAIWHSYQVAYGTDATRTLWANTPIGLIISLILPMFFALSGFLVAGSMYRNPNLRTFLTLRAIRIYPALVTEVILVALILGPIVTATSLAEYFGDRKFYLYLLNMFGLIHFRLPGVFLNNPFPEVINSQLWTVPFELECYILAGMIFLVGFFKHQRRVVPLFLFVTFVIVLLNWHLGVPAAVVGGWNGRLLVLCFFAGMVIFAYKDRIALRGDLALIALVLTPLLPMVHDLLAYVTPLLIAYATTYLGLRNPRHTAVISSGDYSYGVYLYSNPIEQTVQYLIPHATWLVNVSISLPITISFALFSWWCIERPFQKIKRYVLARRNAAPAANAIRTAGGGLRDHA